MPEWVTVKTGLFGTRESFVPLAAAHVDGDELVVDVPKDRVSDAPQLDEDGHLSEDQEAELYRYYGVDPGPFGRLPEEIAADDLAEPSAGAMDDSSYPAVGTLEAPTHEALPDSGYGAGTSGVDPEREYAGSDSVPASSDPALAPEGDPALDPTLDPGLDAELDRRATGATGVTVTDGTDLPGGTDVAGGTGGTGGAAGTAATGGTGGTGSDAGLRPSDIDPATVDADSPALGGPGAASGTPGEESATPPPPRPHMPPTTTGDAYETSRHGDAWTEAEEKAGTEEVKPGRSRLRRWIAGDS
jgi:hypothetical protein